HTLGCIGVDFGLDLDSRVELFQPRLELGPKYYLEQVCRRNRIENRIRNALNNLNLKNTKN
ncbi:hypothetical protein, partial [Desulfovibrio sp. JC022]|uniref:hypothetical protein n=1 Tax=Desulfovibrio sp. JC022 TaxID=2593642 RepID=UPI00193ECBD7